MAKKAKRRYFKAAEKVGILKRHLVEREEDMLRTKVSALESKLQHKDAVLSELMEEHLTLKKALGRPKSLLG